MANDRIFEVAGSTLRFGPGATREVGPELADQGAKRVMVVTDPHLRSLAPVTGALESLEAEGLEIGLFDRVRVEPTDRSFQEAARYAIEFRPDAFVAVGGGSTIDTAKAANLYSTWPADFLDYVFPPLGKGKQVPGPLKPLVAIPTTAGTGSETTGVAIFDLAERHVKTALSHRRLRPSLAIVDPDNTRTMPMLVAASTGLDVLSHAVESLTAIDYATRTRPARPSLRTTYQGANPISDVWVLEALRLVASHLVRAVENPDDDEARAAMCLAASYAGIGFGNAGVHLPHAMSYPVAGLIKSYRPPGYSVDHALAPHGVAVIVCAPAVFRFTGPARPERHRQAAAILGADVSRVSDADAGKPLADQIEKLMDRLAIPRNLAELGYTRTEIPALVDGTLPQSRITALSPRPATPDDLAKLFEDAIAG